MIGEEIVDETDIYVDVHNKIKVVRNRQAASNAGQKLAASSAASSSVDESSAVP